jgi:acetolactate decarboxylase
MEEANPMKVSSARFAHLNQWGKVLLAAGGAVLVILVMAGAVLVLNSRQNVHPAPCVPENRETLLQLAPYSALSAGQFGGFVTVGWLKQKGDVGIGTFDGLDGEMVVIDGNVYQVKVTGVVEAAPDSYTVPFADVTPFDEDIVQDLGSVPNVAALHAALDKLIVRKDSFYAIRVDGVFQHVTLRSVPKQTQPYPELAEALKGQAVFEYENITGTAVGFWSPEYVGGVSWPGYHLHFISADRSMGGHLLEAALANPRVSLDETLSVQLVLRP